MQITNTSADDTQGRGAAVPEESPEQLAQRMAIVEALALSIKEKRKAAIDARRASGIEEIWEEDELHYEGVDEANRDSVKTMLKGRGTTDSPREAKRKSTGSTLFLNITRPYVDAAAARVGDMLLPTGDNRNFVLKPGPVPELTAMLKDTRPAGPDGKPMLADPAMPTAQPPQARTGLVARIGAMFGGQGAPAAPAAPQPKTVAEVAFETIQKAKESAARAQREIDDWLSECRYSAEVRKVIESAAKIGTGILKGPQPTLTRKRAAKHEGDKWMVEIVEKIAPQSKAINHWNFYPDGACGDDIQKGSYVFECDDITARTLADLKKDPTYIPEMIQMCLDEGPCSAVDGTKSLKADQKLTDSDLFQIWYFHGQVSKDDMIAAGCSGGDKDTYPCCVTMVNDRVIKVTLSMLDSGEFPYDVMVWQARPDHWAGIGIARQMRPCQKGAVAAVRNMQDNAGLSAGPQIIIDRNKIEPANKRWEITPRKVWYTKVDEDTEDIRKAFTIINIETRQQELLAIAQFWISKAEEVTGLPMLLQGQMGQANPTDKVGIANIMNNNGSSVLRRIARNFDDRITVPHIDRYYEWLLLYGPDEAKGDFMTEARGSSALVERDLQAQQLVQIVGMSLNPAYGLDPEVVVKEFLKSLRFDPREMELSAAKKAEMANRQPPEDPRITAAKIMAKSKDDAMVAGVQERKMELDHEARENEQERALKKWIATVDAQLESASLSAQERQHLDDVKATLSGLVLKLNTQKNLFVGGAALNEHQRKANQVTQPAAEPPQRAPNGQAFTQ